MITHLATGASNYTITVGDGGLYPCRCGEVHQDMNVLYQHICLHDDILILEHIGSVHGVLCPLCGASWLTKEMPCEAAGCD